MEDKQSITIHLDISLPVRQDEYSLMQKDIFNRHSTRLSWGDDRQTKQIPDA